MSHYIIYNRLSKQAVILVWKYNEKRHSPLDWNKHESCEETENSVQIANTIPKIGTRNLPIDYRYTCTFQPYSCKTNSANDYAV